MTRVARDVATRHTRDGGRVFETHGALQRRRHRVRPRLDLVCGRWRVVCVQLRTKSAKTFAKTFANLFSKTLANTFMYLLARPVVVESTLFEKLAFLHTRMATGHTPESLNQNMGNLGPGISVYES